MASGSPFIWPPYAFDTIQSLWDYLLHFPRCCCEVLQDTICHHSYGILDHYVRMHNWKADLRSSSAYLVLLGCGASSIQSKAVYNYIMQMRHVYLWVCFTHTHTHTHRYVYMYTSLSILGSMLTSRYNSPQPLFYWLYSLTPDD